MTLPVIAIWARFTRAFTLDVMKEDYIRTAQSKGLSEYRVITRHIMRNAMLPLSTMVAFAMVGLLEGSFFVETLTGIPGAGRLAIESIGSRDYDMIMAFTIVTATAFVIMSIVIDIAYTFIDPRIRYGARRN
jgi:ABC-type dipeptide/oligopeptide/nickel transport system permease component